MSYVSFGSITVSISGSEFMMLKGCSTDLPDDVALLDKWYQKDENTVPAVYILRPISSIYYNFNNKVRITHARGRGR